MTRPVVSVQQERPWLDIVSYGRRGPGRRDHIPAVHYEAIARTVRRAPEVVVKVTGGGRNVNAVKQSIDYFDREGELEVETDDGRTLAGEGIGRELVKDWELELETQRSRRMYSGVPGRRSPKLVHNVTFSMPAGTPPKKVLAAVRKFAQDKFAGSHRYAMVLHTDQQHPHVHTIVKAVSEQGVRLNIRKATLRVWRHEFAKYLREQGIEANATDRAVRGVTTPRKPDGIYRAMLRRDSTHVRARTEAVARELVKSDIVVEPGKSKLLQTRKEVERAWQELSEILVANGRRDLANDVARFVQGMPPPRTEKEWLAAELLERVRESRPRDKSLAP